MFALRRVCAVVLILGMWGCGEGPEMETEVLKQQFLDIERNDAARVSAARILLRDGAGMAFVVAHYWKGQRDVVQATIDDLTRAQPDLAGQLLAALMARAQGEEMLAFESQLVSLGSPAVSALVSLSQTDVDWQTAMQILDALGKLKAPEGLEVMARFLSHDIDWVRMAAAHALGDMGGDAVLEPLAGALADTSETVIAAAVIALGKSGERGAVRFCAPVLAHLNPRLRSVAVSAIGRLGGDDARRLLEPMLKDEDSGVRYKTEHALKGLN